jgi:hypothetical protein
MSETEHNAEVQRWLRYAREDLVAAEALVGQRTVAPRHVCWLAQQAAEKATIFRRGFGQSTTLNILWTHDGMMDAASTKPSSDGYLIS